MGKVEKASLAHSYDANGKMSAVFLMFKAGERPTGDVFQELAESGRYFSVSFDPRATSPSGPRDSSTTQNWLELLANGLTFDITGLAGGNAAKMQDPAYRFGFAADSIMLDTAKRSSLECISIAPGPHLIGGDAMLPVIRSQAWLAAMLTHLPGVQAVAWQPARSAVEPVFFRESVSSWIEGGPFPGLGLTAFSDQPGGNLISEGLWLFTGQELLVCNSIAEDAPQRVKVALRLIHWLVENGRISQPIDMTGPGGENFRLEPSADQRIVKVWRT